MKKGNFTGRYIIDKYAISKYINNDKGQTTIFLTVIFISILFFCGILIDTARMVTGRVNVTRAVEDACTSAFALYNSQLKHDYGIFALSENDSGTLKKMIETFLSNNLNINNNLYIPSTSSGEKFLTDIYDFRIEELNVTPVYNLTNNQAVREQILEYMKYRAPKELVENILKKLNILKDTGNMAFLYEKKIELEKGLVDVDNLQRQIKKNISGTLGDGIFEEEYINKFNMNGVRDKVIDDYAGLIEEYKNLLSHIEDKRNYLLQLKELIREYSLVQENEQELNSEQDDDLHYADLKSKIKEAEEEYTNAENQLENIKTHISDVFEQLTHRYTKNFIDINESAIKNIQKLIEIGRKLSSDIYELSRTAALIFDGSENETEITEYGDEPGKRFVSIFLEDIDRLKKLIPDYEEGNRMISILSGNVQALKSSLNALNYIQDRIMAEDTANISIQEIMKVIGEVNEKYGTIEFDYQVYGKSVYKDDPRKNAAVRVKDGLWELIAKGLNMKEKEINFEELPSAKKVPETDFSKADESYLDNFDDISLVQETPEFYETEEDCKSSLDAEQAYQGDLSSIYDDIDLIDVKGNFLNKVFSFISNIGKAMGSNMADMRDELYINQYIIDVFNNRVDTKAGNSDHRIEEKGESNSENRLENHNKKSDEEKHNSSFQNEVEYILHGGRLEQINVAKTTGQIALLRFGINTLQIYMDATKRKEAYSLATAIAGWWTGGAGIPVISNLILCSWGITDGINDLKQLMEGEEVPIFKDSNIKFTYEDYLMLFLMLEDSDTKIERVQDLIEMNIKKSKNDFRMSATHCAIRVEAEISMKYLFITKSFMPSRLKSADGRHKIKVLLYEGY